MYITPSKTDQNGAGMSHTTEQKLRSREAPVPNIPDCPNSRRVTAAHQRESL